MNLKPLPGTVQHVAPGIHWVRLPLPFQLDHVNVWLLEDGNGWTLVDTGFKTDAVRSVWEDVFATVLGGRPIRRIIVTHFHPDHVGMAGWIAERFGAQLWMPILEWSIARMLAAPPNAATVAEFQSFYRAAGFPEGLMALCAERTNHYPGGVTPIPPLSRRIEDGDTLDIGTRSWRALQSGGHAPGHISLSCEADGLLISGDQILPEITPNISVWPQEPNADPLRAYLSGLFAFDTLADGTTVLPSHRMPFSGLKARTAELRRHHEDRLEQTLDACANPSTGVEISERLFDRELDDHQLFFAVGESLAHLHYLMTEDSVRRCRRDDGVYTYVRNDERPLDNA